jgi:hypothetical protein
MLLLSYQQAHLAFRATSSKLSSCFLMHTRFPTSEGESTSFFFRSTDFQALSQRNSSALRRDIRFAWLPQSRLRGGSEPTASSDTEEGMSEILGEESEWEKHIPENLDDDPRLAKALEELDEAILDAGAAHCQSLLNSWFKVVSVPIQFLQESQNCCISAHIL